MQTSILVSESCQSPASDAVEPPLFLLTEPASPLQVTTATGRDGTGQDVQPDVTVQSVDPFLQFGLFICFQVFGTSASTPCCCCCCCCLMSVSCPRPASILLIKRIPTLCFCHAFLCPFVFISP